VSEYAQGVYVGIVKANKLDDEGRIQIMMEGINQSGVYLARIASLMAGNNMGIEFLPEVGDQVLVAFEQGSFNKPIVIGSLWNKRDKPPVNNSDGNNNIKIIKTRGGNEIRITCNESEESIAIASGNVKVTISHNGIKMQGNVQITGTLDVGTGAKTHIEGNEITGKLS
jgi:uncharacterized protein involved in type VI secretion and phage assembly